MIRVRNEVASDGSAVGSFSLMAAVKDDDDDDDVRRRLLIVDLVVARVPAVHHAILVVVDR